MWVNAQRLNEGVRLNATHGVVYPSNDAWAVAGGLALNHQLPQHSLLMRETMYLKFGWGWGPINDTWYRCHCASVSEASSSSEVAGGGRDSGSTSTILDAPSVTLSFLTQGFEKSKKSARLSPWSSPPLLPALGAISRLKKVWFLPWEFMLQC